MISTVAWIAFAPSFGCSAPQISVKSKVRDQYGGRIVTIAAADRKRIVFRKVSTQLASPSISPDKRSVAYAVGDRVYVWSKPTGLRRFQLPRLPDGFGEGVYWDGGLLWSPDSKRMIVWEPEAQGSMILGVGAVFVLEVATSRWRYITSAGNPHWISNSTIHYEWLIYDEGFQTYAELFNLNVVKAGSKPLHVGIDFWRNGEMDQSKL